MSKKKRKNALQTLAEGAANAVSLVAAIPIFILDAVAS
jgi:hypothetical protein